MFRTLSSPIIFVLAVVLASASSAGAQTQARQTYTGKFTSSAPGTSTGLEQTIHYQNPSDPDGKPYAVSEVIFALPPGSVVDTTVPPQCGASEAEFQTSGTDACPAETRVGDGTLTADTGVEGGAQPRVIETAVTFFNNQDELILFAESTNTNGPPIRVASRVVVRDKRELVSKVPPLPGSPPPEPYLALKDIFNRLEPRTVGGKHYITTPPTCPASGSWTITATFTYRDGTVETVESKTPCDAAPAGRDTTPPRIRISGAPRRGCTTRAFRLRVRVADASGVRRAQLALDGRRLMTTKKARFSRRIRAGKLRPGRHRLTVVAIDKAGNRSVKKKRFRVCAKKKTARGVRGCGARAARFSFIALNARASC